jgi:ectoine hydroxylase-related dioxygenase (phytanoyl-CoA dioxygenase family)
MICLDGMQSGQGATRVIPGSQHWSREAADEWCKRNVPLEATGEVLLCTPGSLVILGPTIIHGAEANLSAIPRRNLIMQWGRISDLFCVESPESLTGYVPSELSYPGDRTENFVPAGMIAMREASFTYPT